GGHRGGRIGGVEPVIVPPDFPDQAPSDSRSLYEKGRQVADALRSAREQGDADAFAEVGEAAGDASYLSREDPKIIADLDTPKSYEDLKAASDEASRLGYQNHHIGQGDKGKSFEEQLEYGKKVLRDFGVMQ